MDLLRQTADQAVTVGSSMGEQLLFKIMRQADFFVSETLNSR
jgi:hypothetical protein